jgi:phosphatidate phosphatase LPIN
MLGNITPLSSSPRDGNRPVISAGPGLAPSPMLVRSASVRVRERSTDGGSDHFGEGRPKPTERISEPMGVPSIHESPDARSTSPPPLTAHEALNRAMALSKRLSATNIPTHITETGDLMLDMTGYKSSEDDALRAEVIARKVLAEELDGNYDIGALIGADEQGNLWIYSSEEAKETALRKLQPTLLPPRKSLDDAASDPGYHSDDERLLRDSSDAGKTIEHSAVGLQTPPQTPPEVSAGDPNRNYAKTLRLTSDQLKALNLSSGENSMSFTVNKATCHASMFYWKYNVPVVISDIDGTITK